MGQAIIRKIVSFLFSFFFVPLVSYIHVGARDKNVTRIIRKARKINVSFSSMPEAYVAGLRKGREMVNSGEKSVTRRRARP